MRVSSISPPRRRAASFALRRNIFGFASAALPLITGMTLPQTRKVVGFDGALRSLSEDGFTLGKSTFVFGGGAETLVLVFAFVFAIVFAFLSLTLFFLWDFGPAFPCRIESCRNRYILRMASINHFSNVLIYRFLGFAFFKWHFLS